METRFRYGKRLYGIWVGMRARCRDEGHHAYERYGGRGISVCAEWLDYETFAQWALANGYTDELTLERNDVDGNYCPENCSWITRGEQARNRRSNVSITFNGVTKTCAEWSRDLGLDKHAVSRRLKRGMSIEEALTTPKIQPKAPLKKVYQYQDDTLVGVWSCAKEAAEKVCGNPRTIKWACNHGGKKAYGFVWRYDKKEDKK